MITTFLGFLSPFCYIALLGGTLIAREYGLTRHIDTTFHNYNMALQSCVLLSIVMFDYYQCSVHFNLRLSEFIAISNQCALYEQTKSRQHLLGIMLISKLCEWIDTVLLIINNRPLILLHLWHHATIVIGFYTCVFTSSLYWIGFMNNTIHIIMYLYYANVRFIRPYARYLTILQIVQLFGGVYMSCLSHAYHKGDTKRQTYSIVNGLICLSYGLLFIQFYAGRYCKSKSTDTKADKSTISTHSSARPGHR
jgi:hypothetical protein